MKKKQRRYPTIQEYRDFAESSYGRSYMEEHFDANQVDTKQFFGGPFGSPFFSPFFFFPRFFFPPFFFFHRFRRF